MKPAPFRYIRVTTLAQTVDELAEHGDRARLLAGGQTLIQQMNARQAVPEVLVDINAVAELNRIDIGPDEVRIGAMCRIADLERDKRLAAILPALVESAGRIAHPAVRNRGTIGGNVAHADPASGMPPVLLAYAGEVVLTGPMGTRTVPATTFFTGYRTTARTPDEVITELRFPRPAPRTGAAFVEISRRARGWGLVGACAVVHVGDDNRVEYLRLALLGMAPTAVRPVLAERSAHGQILDTGTIRRLGEAAVADLAQVPDDVHASARLRLSLGRAVVRRALVAAIERIEGT